MKLSLYNKTYHYCEHVNHCHQKQTFVNIEYSLSLQEPWTDKVTHLLHEVLHFSILFSTYANKKINFQQV